MSSTIPTTTYLRRREIVSACITSSLHHHNKQRQQQLLLLQPLSIPTTTTTTCSLRSGSRNVSQQQQQQQYVQLREWRTTTRTIHSQVGVVWNNHLHHHQCRTFETSILLPQKQPQQIAVLQVRYFGKGLQPRKHMKQGFANDEVKLQVCYSDYDLQLDEEEDLFNEEIQDMTFTKCKFNLRNIKEVMEGIFDDSRNIQYYASNDSGSGSSNNKTNRSQQRQHTWRPLTDLSAMHMQQYRGGKTALQVRIPDQYDATPMDDDDDENSHINPADWNLDSDDEDYDASKRGQRNRIRKGRNINTREGNSRRNNITNIEDDTDNIDLDLKPVLLQATIRKLVAKLKEEKYVRSDGVVYGEGGRTSKIIYSMIHTETKVKILTADYVMNEATTDEELSRLLLAMTGSFNHIVKCLHYDVVWGDGRGKRPKRLRNGYIRW